MSHISLCRSSPTLSGERTIWRGLQIDVAYAVMMLIAFVMIGGTPEAVKGARKCGLNDLTLTNEYVTTSICRFGVRNNCPCEAFNVVASCEDRRWTYPELGSAHCFPMPYSFRE
ncbi:hypothetical protein KP509_1Z078500 [Ceratopteris richardii]|nr:hypothetical protein KP509_1Z078500 [Ceratopteris richardii]